MCDYLALVLSKNDFLALLQKKLDDAAENAAIETKCAILIQTTFRWSSQKKDFLRHIFAVIQIERVYRGHRGRLRVHAARHERVNYRQIALFKYFSMQLQKCFRGYYSRKYKSSFYRRKGYLQTIASRGEAARARMEQYAREQESYDEMEASNQKLQMQRGLASNLHHLLSTKQIRGVYNPHPFFMETPKFNDEPVEDLIRGVVKDLLKTRTLNGQSRKTLTADLRGTKRVPYTGLKNRLSVQASSPYNALQKEATRKLELHRIITRGRGNFLAGQRTRIIDHNEPPMTVGDPFVDQWANPLLIRGVPESQKQLLESSHTRKALFIKHQEQPFYITGSGNKSTVLPNDVFDVIADAEQTGGAIQRQLGTSVRFGVPDNADKRIPAASTDGHGPMPPIRTTARLPSRTKVRTFTIPVRSTSAPLEGGDDGGPPPPLLSQRSQRAQPTQSQRLQPKSFRGNNDNDESSEDEVYLPSAPARGVDEDEGSVL